MFKSIARQSLGHVVGSLVGGFDLDEGEFALELPEPVPFD